MFVHNIDPVILELGSLQIRYYGLIYAAGFAFALYYLMRQSKLGRLDLTKDEISDFITYLIVGVVAGARLFEVIFYEPSYYLSDPAQILMVWKGGLSFHGGLVGAIAATYIFLKKHPKVSFLELADNLMVPLSLGLAFGRIANFINAELVGKITDVSWAVKFPGYEGFRHPSQIYESIKNFIIFGTLLSFKDLPRGAFFAIFLMMYGTFRFLVEFYKDFPTFLGLNMGQYLSIPMIVAGIWLFRKVRS